MGLAALCPAALPCDIASVWVFFSSLESKDLFWRANQCSPQTEDAICSQAQIGFSEGLLLSKIHRLKAVAGRGLKWSFAPSAAQWMQTSWCMGEQGGACSEPGVLAPAD